MKKILLLVAVLAVGGYFYLQPTEETDDTNLQNEEKEVVFNRGNNGDMDSLDPLTCDGSWESNIFQDAFENLVTEDPYGKVVPGMAKSWEILDEGKTYVFHIREDAKWSDGTELTAHDFEFSMKNLVNPFNAYKFANILDGVINAKEIRTGKNKDIESLAVTALNNKTLEINNILKLILLII